MKTIVCILMLMALVAVAQINIFIQVNGVGVANVQINSATNSIPPVQTNIVYAATGFYDDVTNAIGQCQQGGTVVIPAGTFYWAKTVTVSGITLAGLGTNSTVIKDETPPTGSPYSSAGTPILQLSPVTANRTVVSNIYFFYGVTNNRTTYPGNYGREVTITGGTPNWRINNCKFEQLSGKNVSAIYDAYGVVDHCTFVTADTIALEVNGIEYGDVDWSTATTYGTSNAVYFENNVITNAYGGDSGNFGWVDVSTGGRAVFRYSYFINSYMNTHGTESGGRYRSARYVEVYNNVFTNAHVGNFNNIYTANDIRGGGLLLFSNSIYGYNNIGFCRDYRGTANFSSFAPFWGATGLTNWDLNGVQVESGTALATSGVLTNSGKVWTNSQYVGCSVFNYNNYRCGIVTANTSNTMSFASTAVNGNQITFAAGDTYTIHRIKIMMDQPGAGQGDLLTNLFTPPPTYLNFQTNTIYAWTNYFVRYANNVGVPTTPNFGTDGTSPNLVEGMAYSNNVAKPGYTPFTYPHPLTQ